MLTASTRAAAGVSIALIMATSAQAQEQGQDLASLCGVGGECVCEPLPPNDGPAIVVNIAELDEGEPVCPPDFVLVVDTAPAAIRASPQ